MPLYITYAVDCIAGSDLRTSLVGLSLIVFTAYCYCYCRGHSLGTSFGCGMGGRKS